VKPGAATDGMAARLPGSGWEAEVHRSCASRSPWQVSACQWVHDPRLDITAFHQLIHGDGSESDGDVCHNQSIEMWRVEGDMGTSTLEGRCDVIDEACGSRDMSHST
jgi:hypothetical protein